MTDMELLTECCAAGIFGRCRLASRCRGQSILRIASLLPRVVPTESHQIKPLKFFVPATKLLSPAGQNARTGDPANALRIQNNRAQSCLIEGRFFLISPSRLSAGVPRTPKDAPAVLIFASFASLARIPNRRDPPPKGASLPPVPLDSFYRGDFSKSHSIPPLFFAFVAKLSESPFTRPWIRMRRVFAGKPRRIGTGDQGRRPLE